MIDTTRTQPAGVLLVAAMLAGCGSDEMPSAFAEINRMPTKEELVEIEIGTFIVPVPVVLESATDRFEPANLMQIEMDLIAIADPDRSTQVERLLELNAGRVRDRVIRVCRTTTRDDLTEAQKSTLKAHLLDAIQPLLGGDAIRNLAVLPASIDEL